MTKNTHTPAPLGAHNKREELLKWAGWAFAILSVLNLVLAIVNMVTYLNPNYDWVLHIEQTYGQSFAGIDANSEKISCITDCAFDIVFCTVYFFLSFVFFKQAEIFYDEEFDRKKMLWISIIGLITVSLLGGILGVVACNKKNQEQKEFAGMSTSNDNEEAFEKIRKLRSLKEQGIISQEEFESLTNQVLDGETFVKQTPQEEVNKSVVEEEVKQTVEPEQKEQEMVEQKPKRGRPRKVVEEEVKQTVEPEQKEQEMVEQKPKRGRPRKKDTE